MPDPESRRKFYPTSGPEFEDASNSAQETDESQVTGSYQRFLLLKTWHEQMDLLDKAGRAPGEDSLRFLEDVVNDLEGILAKTEGLSDEERIHFYGSETYPMAGTNFDAIVEAEEGFGGGYRDYFVRHLSEQFANFDLGPDLRQKAEKVLLDLLDKVTTLSGAQRDEYNESDRTGALDAAVDEHPHGFFDDQRDYHQLEEISGFMEIAPWQRAYEGIVGSLRNIGSRQSVKPLVDLMKEEPIALARSIGLTLSKIAPDAAAQELLALWRDEDVVGRRDAARALYLLELDRLGISEKGVEYLGKVYDLGTLNNPDYFVQRLSDQGEIGVFNGKEELMNYFKLDLETQSGVVRPELLSFTLEKLFVPRSDESDEERRQREETAKEFVQKYYGFLHNDFFEGTGVALNNNSLREQVGFYQYFSKISDQGKEKLKSFLTKFGDSGLRTFLAMQHGHESGEQIVGLADNLSRRTTEKVFAEYLRVADFANIFYEQLGPELQSRLGNEFSKEEWYDRLLKRARSFLEQVYHLSISPTGQESPLSYPDLVRTIRDSAPHLLIAHCHEAVIQGIAVELANSFGVEEIRDILNQTRVPQADKILSFINPEASEQIHRDLRDFYNSINFEGYSLNQRMQTGEVGLLERELAKSDKVLDLGAGTGRHLVPLRQGGFDIEGFDYVHRHAQIIKQESPDSFVVRGDWVDTPYPSERYDAIYSLGRNILHEFQPHRQRQLFAEAARILKPGGKFIFDIPDRSKGSYHMLAEAYGEKLKQRHITNFRYGTVYDSPDGKIFSTRYIYSPEDIANLAAENGFVVDSVERTPLETGKGDVNIYYVLRKVSRVEETELRQAA